LREHEKALFSAATRIFLQNLTDVGGGATIGPAVTGKRKESDCGLRAGEHRKE